MIMGSIFSVALGSAVGVGGGAVAVGVAVSDARSVGDGVSVAGSVAEGDGVALAHETRIRAVIATNAHRMTR